MIEARTRLDKQEINSLNKFHLFRKNIWMLVIPMIFFSAFGVLNILSAEDMFDKIFGMIFITVFGLGFPLFAYLIMKVIVWLQLRSTRLISNETENYFKIDGDILYNKLEKTDCISTFEAKWNLVYKAYETKTHFFIYISNMQAFIISKSGIFNGTSEELREMLRSSIGKNFKIYGK